MAYFGAPPTKKESIWVIAAQWALETGWGKHMHCWNLGNVKSRDGDGYDYCFFGCGEEVTTAEANRWKAADPNLVQIKRIYTNAKGVSMASVWVEPKHWVSRFRAFNSFTEGALDYIGLLVRRFHLAWEGVEKGDPALFSHLARQQGYYTADEAQYTKTIKSTFSMISKVPFDYDSLPVLTEAEKEQLSNLVTLTVQQSVDDYLHGSSSDSDPDA